MHLRIINKVQHNTILTSIEQIRAAAVKNIVEKLAIVQTIEITSVGMK